MAAKFEVYKDKAGKFRYRLKAANGQIILTGEAYNSKTACIEGVQSVKKNSQRDSAFEIYEDKKGGCRFRLRAANKEVIGQGEAYSDRTGCNRGVALVKRNAAEAKIVEV